MFSNYELLIVSNWLEKSLNSYSPASGLLYEKQQIRNYELTCIINKEGILITLQVGEDRMNSVVATDMLWSTMRFLGDTLVYELVAMLQKKLKELN